jgi:ribosomal protein S18 acetylase RimI-like enzyme
MAGPALRSRAWRSTGDTDALRELLSRRLAVDWPAVRMHPGDLDWWSVQAWGDDRPPVEDRVRIWSIGDGRRPAAFAWFSPPGDVDLVVDPGIVDGPGPRSDDLHRELVDWALERHARLAPGHDAPLRLWALEGGTEAGWFEVHGLRRDTGTDGYVHLTGPLEALATEPPTIPAGLEVRPIEDADVPARVRCGRAAFVTSTMTPARYRRTFLAGSYRRELDRVVVDGAGAVLAFALGWYDPPTRIVELEPVGVDPGHQRRGLGTLVCRSVLGAARGLGARRAMIAAERSNAAAVGLYRSLGLAVTSTIVPFALPVTPMPPDAGMG